MNNYGRKKNRIKGIAHRHNIVSLLKDREQQESVRRNNHMKHILFFQQLHYFEGPKKGGSVSFVS